MRMHPGILAEPAINERALPGYFHAGREVLDLPFERVGAISVAAHRRGSRLPGRTLRSSWRGVSATAGGLADRQQNEDERRQQRSRKDDLHVCSFPWTFLPSEKSSNAVAIDRSGTTQSLVSPPQAVDRRESADNSKAY
jgi:hypothetical protein